MSDQYSKPFIPVIQKTSTLVRMAVMAVVVFAVAFFSRVEIISETYETKVNAAGQMAKAMEMLKEVRLEKGVFVDVENDPNETGLVGSQFSLTTTDEGDLDAKLSQFRCCYGGTIGSSRIAVGRYNSSYAHRFHAGSQYGHAHCLRCNEYTSCGDYIHWSVSMGSQ